MQALPAFAPPYYLRNRHIQTLLNSQGPRRLRAARILSRLHSETLILQASDGTRLLAELNLADDAQKKLVVLLHGWEGSSRSSYIITCAERLLHGGFDVLRVNLRDHGDSHALNPGLFNSTLSPEVGSALAGFLASRDYSRVCLAGFSLGASFALRIAADDGVWLGLDTVIAICPPTDPARAMQALNEGLFAYERYFFKRWRSSLQCKLRHFPELDYAAELASAGSLDDLNRIFIPRYTPYASVEEYFSAYALVGDRLAGLSMPAYLIAAEDDPIIPVADLQRIDAIDRLSIETCRYGGHCGFIVDLAAHSWVESRILQLCDEVSTG